MSTYLRLGLVAAALAATCGGAVANAEPQCLDMGPSQPFIGGPVPISRPQYVDPDPFACVSAVVSTLPPLT
ncbi:MAG TPA: hypothetical protein VF519_03225 [Mycobacteriales bacterium]|jgi:hypothetical protein